MIAPTSQIDPVSSTVSLENTNEHKKEGALTFEAKKGFTPNDLLE
jgi:hypothetical protein